MEFCRWGADVSRGETSQAARSKEKRLNSQANLPNKKGRRTAWSQVNCSECKLPDGWRSKDGHYKQIWMTKFPAKRRIIKMAARERFRLVSSRIPCLRDYWWEGLSEFAFARMMSSKISSVTTGVRVWERFSRGKRSLTRVFSLTPTSGIFSHVAKKQSRFYFKTVLNPLGIGLHFSSKTYW